MKRTWGPARPRTGWRLGFFPVWLGLGLSVLINCQGQLGGAGQPAVDAAKPPGPTEANTRPPLPNPVGEGHPGPIEQNVEPPTPAPSGVVASTASGNWSDPTIWNDGVVPGENADVRISRGHTVVYDIDRSVPIRTVLVNGRLSFSRAKTTRLVVGLMVVTDNQHYDMNENACGHHGHHEDPRALAALAVGSADAPIPATIRTLIRLRHFEDMDASCAPGIINHATMSFHGAPLDETWVKLSATAAAGSQRVTVAKPVGWKVGDKVIVTATNRQQGGRGVNDSILNGTIIPRTEESTIVEISPDGQTITLADALRYEHRGAADPSERRGEIANLSRNVVVESADPDGVRGHTMYHHGSRGSIGYAEFRHLGKAAGLGRYPIHFHLVKDTMRGTFVQGASIWDSANRWITVHGTEYMVIRDTVGYQSLGHGFFLEDGSEIYSLFHNNLGVQAYVADPISDQALAYDPNDGACYWAANARNFIFDNTFVECDNDDSFILDYAPDGAPMPTEILTPDGQRRTVDVRTLSGGLIRGLEVHSHGGWGPWIRGGAFPEDEPLVFQDTRVWNTHYSIDISGSNVIFDGVEVYAASYGFYNLFPGPHLVRNAYCESVNLHGCYMTYRGGHGTMLYDGITATQSHTVFRITARNEQGPQYSPIKVHARDVKIIDSDPNKTHWSGTEGDNVRSDPLLMLVLHDVLDSGDDAVVLPAKQSTVQQGVPTGLTFSDGADITAAGMDFEGRGAMQVAAADVAWPDSPLYRPVDKLPPATTILAPQSDALARRREGKITVRGVSLDQFGIATVTINGQPAELASNGFDWRVELQVQPGPLTLTAVATDVNGNTEATSHSVHLRVR